MEVYNYLILIFLFIIVISYLSQPFFAIFVVLMVMIFIKPFIMPFHTIISLIIASIIIGISFILLLWLIGFDEDDKQVISALKAMFFKNK